MGTRPFSAVVMQSLSRRNGAPAMLRSVEPHEPSGGRGEAAGFDVELSQGFVEVNMQPVTARSLAFGPREVDHLGADTPATVSLDDHRVLNPGMRNAIPYDVDKSDDASVLSCNDPTEAVLRDEVIPVPFGVGVHARVKGFGVECVDLCVLKGSAPFVTQRHPVRVPGAPSGARRLPAFRDRRQIRRL
jgi:hypothetical protein